MYQLNLFAWRRIPFYSSLSRDIFLIEAAETGRTGAYYIVHDNTAGNTTILLDGKGSSIHEINKEFNFYLNSSSQAVEYLKFFTSSISADGGIFLIVEPDEKYLSRSLINEIGISPTRVVSQTTNGWEIDADVIYDNYVFSAEFFVEKNGNVTMIDDKPKNKLTLTATLWWTVVDVYTFPINKHLEGYGLFPNPPDDAVEFILS